MNAGCFTFSVPAAPNVFAKAPGGNWKKVKLIHVFTKTQFYAQQTTPSLIVPLDIAIKRKRDTEQKNKTCLFSSHSSGRHNGSEFTLHRA